MDDARWVMNDYFLPFVSNPDFLSGKDSFQHASVLAILEEVELKTYALQNSFFQFCHGGGPKQTQSQQREL